MDNIQSQAATASDNPNHNNSRQAKVELYVGASLAKVSRERSGDTHRQSPLGGRRGMIQTFSYASRRRLMRQVAKIRLDVPTLFVTLTYPDEFPSDPSRWKRDLKNFAARLKRSYQNASFIWRLELQTRKSGQNAGSIAPHYHLLLYGVDTSDQILLDNFREWLSLAWYEIVDSGDAKHLRAGTNCTVMRSPRGVMSYASKYLGKTEKGDEEGVGRYWGVYYRSDLPEVDVDIIELTDRQAVKVMRWFRKFARVPGRQYQSLSIMLNASRWRQAIQQMIEEDNQENAIGS